MGSNNMFKLAAFSSMADKVKLKFALHARGRQQLIRIVVCFVEIVGMDILDGLVERLRSSVPFDFKPVDDPEVHVLDRRWNQGAMSLEVDIESIMHEGKARDILASLGFEEGDIRGYYLSAQAA